MGKHREGLDLLPRALRVGRNSGDCRKIQIFWGNIWGFIQCILGVLIYLGALLEEVKENDRYL